jgi:hypothetical protein
MSDRTDLFRASAAALGYLYQLRVALLVGVDRMQSDLDWTIAVEAGDDIESTTPEGTEWWQLKHRAPGTRMTNSSSDLWKTLRIWATAVLSNDFELDRTDFFLLTTGTAAQGSVGHFLGPRRDRGQRDVARALELLERARSRSHDQSSTASANFAAWDALSPKLKMSLLNRVQILDQAEDISSTGSQLLGRANLVVGRRHAPAFVQRLEGWFFQQCISHLAGRTASPVTGAELDEVWEQIRRQFGSESLPIDGDIADFAPSIPQYSDKTFVHQLELAGITGNRVRRAVFDYVKAFEQRSRWVDENLLPPGELGAYERRLIDEWQRRFDVMADELGAQAAEEEMRDEAKRIYRWVELEARFSIRPGCDETFITTGSYQMLSDELRVGWHPTSKPDSWPSWNQLPTDDRARQVQPRRAGLVQSGLHDAGDLPGGPGASAAARSLPTAGCSYRGGHGAAAGNPSAAT